MTRPTVLVLGASGRFGQAAVQAFAAAGWRVLAQQRRAPASTLPAGVLPITTPLADTGTLTAQAAGASVVVHAIHPPYHRWDAELLPLAHQGLDVCERLGATFMLPGNVYNFGDTMPALLRTDTPPRPHTNKGRQRVALEAEMQARTERAGSGGMKAVVVRAGDFYGSGRGSWFDQAIVKDLARGRLVYPGPLDVPHAWAYLPDLARAFVAVAARASRGEVPAFEALHFAGHSCTGRELLAGIEVAATELGLAPPAGMHGWQQAGLPWGLIRVVGLVHAPWRELARMRYLWQRAHALDGNALLQAVGPLPATPLPLALRQTLVDLRLAPDAARLAAA